MLARDECRVIGECVTVSLLTKIHCHILALKRSGKARLFVGGFGDDGASEYLQTDSQLLQARQS